MAAALVACATPPPVELGGRRVAGRLSLQVEGDAPRQVGGSFELLGDAHSGRLALSTPLGTRVAEARWSGGAAWLSGTDGERRYGSMDELTREALGEPLPLQALFDWLQGRPWEGNAWRSRDDGRAGFVQMGWAIDLSRFAEGFVEAQREAPPAVRLRLRIDESGPVPVPRS